METHRSEPLAPSIGNPGSFRINSCVEDLSTAGTYCFEAKLDGLRPERRHTSRTTNDGRAMRQDLPGLVHTPSLQPIAYYNLPRGK